PCSPPSTAADPRRNRRCDEDHIGRYVPGKRLIIAIPLWTFVTQKSYVPSPFRARDVLRSSPAHRFTKGDSMCRDHNCPNCWIRTLLILLLRIGVCWLLTHH